MPPGDLGPQAAGSGQAGGGESCSPSPGGLPGGWSLLPLGPRLATSSHLALRPGQQLPALTGRGVWAHTGPARLSLGSASLAETPRAQGLWLPDSALLGHPPNYPLGALRLSGASPHLAGLGAAGLGTPLRSASQAEQGAQLTQSSGAVGGLGEGLRAP